MIADDKAGTETSKPYTKFDLEFEFHASQIASHLGSTLTLNIPRGVL